MDSGYDETHNPFADVSEEYTKKKEENLKKKSVKRMSERQRQYNKVEHFIIMIYFTTLCMVSYTVLLPRACGHFLSTFVSLQQTQRIHKLLLHYRLTY